MATLFYPACPATEGRIEEPLKNRGRSIKDSSSQISETEVF